MSPDVQNQDADPVHLSLKSPCLASEIMFPLLHFLTVRIKEGPGPEVNPEICKCQKCLCLAVVLTPKGSVREKYRTDLLICVGLSSITLLTNPWGSPGPSADPSKEFCLESLHDFLV